MAKTGNGNIVKWVGIILSIILAAAGLIYSFGVQGEQLKANCKADDAIHPQVPILDNRVTRVEVNVENINKNIAEQKTMQQQILIKQDQILLELTK